MGNLKTICGSRFMRCILFSLIIFSQHASALSNQTHKNIPNISNVLITSNNFNGREVNSQLKLLTDLGFIPHMVLPKYGVIGYLPEDSDKRIKEVKIDC